jgi:YD repeat-containing protein
VFLGQLYASETIHYSYDDMNRLIGVAYGDGTTTNYTLEYTYDLMGNRSSRLVIAGSPDNNPPNEPSGPSPEIDAINVNPNNVELAWSGGDPDGDIVTYDVFFWMDTENPAIYTRTTSTSVILGQLQTGKTYYWKVIAKDSHNQAESGPEWKFTTGNNPPDSPS